MSEILNRAKSAQRDAAHNTHITIRLSMLEDLIAEIERLETRLALANPVGKGLKAVVDNAGERKP